MAAAKKEKGAPKTPKAPKELSVLQARLLPARTVEQRLFQARAIRAACRREQGLEAE